MVANRYVSHKPTGRKNRPRSHITPRDHLALAYYPLTPGIALQRGIAKRNKRKSHRAVAPLFAKSVPLAEPKPVEQEPVQSALTPMAAWNAAYTQLQMQCDRQQFETFIKPLTFIEFRKSDRTFRLLAHNAAARDKLQRTFNRFVWRTLWTAYGGKPIQVEFVAVDDPKRDKPVPVDITTGYKQWQQRRLV